MATENLKVKITADATQAKAEIGKFKNSLKDTVGSAESAAASVKKLKVALGALAAVKVAQAMVKNAISVAAMGDEIKDNAQKVFMGTTAYQEWGYVLKQNGVEMGALKMGMRKFAQEVASGSPALQKYGITATDVDTAFQQAVATIQNMSSETERIAAATELFGTRALELMPVLNLTNAETQNLMATYRAIGGTMSNELIAASDVCTDSILEMKMAWQGLKNVLAAYIIPIITKVVQWITIAIAYVRIFLKALFGIKETFGGKSGNSKKSLAGTSASVATNTGNTSNNLKKAAKHAKELKRTMMGIDELSRLAEKATAAAASGGSGGGSVSTPAVSVGDPGTFDGIISEETLTKIQNFQEKIDAVKEKLNGAYLILKGLTEIAFGNPIQGFKDIGDGIAKMLPDSVKQKWDEFKASVEGGISAIIKLIFPNWDDEKGVWENLKSNFKTIWAEAKLKIGTKWADLKKNWDNLIKNAKGTTADVKVKIASKWSDLKKKWKNLMDKFKDKKVSISLQFSAAASDIKAWINSHVFSKINSTLANAPLIGGWAKKHPIKLAKGGILTEPTTALMAEYPGARSNPEIATPQSLMYETIQRANGDLVTAFASMTRQVIAAIESKDLDVRIGDEAIARSAQRGNSAYKRRTGTALISG